MGESNINSKLKKRRKELGLTMKEVSAAVGVSEGTVSRWESGNIANMGRDKIYALSKVLKMTPAEIMGIDDDSSTQTSSQFHYKQFLEEIQNPNNSWIYRVPLYKSVKIENGEIVLYNFIKWISIDDERAKNFIALLIPGKEFEPKYSDKDIALINQQSTLEDNKYFYILINGKSPTIRKVTTKENNTIVLQADNPQIGIELANKNDIVVGKLIAIHKIEKFD
ncbi:MAG: XRE family transcriptional regulator [Clostridia bacterium]|nr:XRE family transcriptional regulator [Clostridia bacterium]